MANLQSRADTGVKWLLQMMSDLPQLTALKGVLINPHVFDLKVSGQSL